MQNIIICALILFALMLTALIGIGRRAQSTQYRYDESRAAVMAGLRMYVRDI